LGGEAASLSLAPYFPPHTQRNIYLSLLHHHADDNEKAAKVPDSILRAALLARAQEDIPRIIEVRTRKQALSTLLQRGVVGDEIWQRVVRAEQELEAEVKDVVQEVRLRTGVWKRQARALAKDPGTGDSVFFVRYTLQKGANKAFLLT
jgi:translocation protein SEC66